MINIQEVAMVVRRWLSDFPTRTGKKRNRRRQVARASVVCAEKEETEQDFSLARAHLGQVNDFFSNEYSVSQLKGKSYSFIHSFL